jgi:ferritin-like metal-binding protein YciE
MRVFRNRNGVAVPYRRGKPVFHRHHVDFRRNIDGVGRLARQPQANIAAFRPSQAGRRRLFHETQRNPTMGLFTKDIKTMDDLYLHVLQDIYYAENQIKKALPDMIEKATNRDLTAAFKSHLEETEKQIGRLEQAFQLLGKDPKGTACPAIDGILKEANEVAGECDNKMVLDAALIAAAQAVEHYEITRYGSMIAWSEELGREAIAKLLTTNLNEEKAADKKLTSIGEKKVNLKAAG